MPKCPKGRRKKSAGGFGSRSTATDAAAFSKSDLEAIHGSSPASWMNPRKTANDAHHILGRGQEFGILKSHPLRRIFSSPFNMAPLDRENHDKADLKDYDRRCMFLTSAIDAVMRAVGEGRYVLQEKDHLFLRFCRAWRLNPRAPQLLRAFL